MNPEDILKILQKQEQVKGKNLFNHERAERVTAVILSVLMNKDLCHSLLEKLNIKVGIRMNLGSLPTITRKYHSGHSTSLPEPSECVSEQEERCLAAFEEVLLEEEQKLGINLGLTVKTVPEFFMQVPDETANKVVAAGYLWNENISNPISFIHGRYSHRLQHYIVASAIRQRLVDVSILNGYADVYKQGQILKYLITSETKYHSSVNSLQFHSHSFWHTSLDNDRHQPYSICKVLLDRSGKSRFNLAGPTHIHEFLLSQNSFIDYPYLAHAIQASNSQQFNLLSIFGSVTAQQIFINFISLSDRKMLTTEQMKLTHSAIENYAEQDLENGYFQAVGTGYIRNYPSLAVLEKNKGSELYGTAIEHTRAKNYDMAIDDLTKAFTNFDFNEQHRDCVTTQYALGLNREKQTHEPFSVQAAYTIAAKRGEMSCPSAKIMEKVRQKVQPKN